jgi:serine/threonine protein kinase/tetratricopeptide (TPR) repeat protein
MDANGINSLAAALRERYTIDRKLGRGGMATVYLARDLKHDRLVALKVLHPELAATLGLERFEREIRLAARLDHPHIVPVFDSGEAAGLLWYTMPYVEGESLRERLQREGQLPLEDAIQLAGEVAEALDCAHQNSIIHRDIKPENILLSSRGGATGGAHARVADFGLARAVEAAGAKRLTETGLAMGTPAYMSPEQASAGPVDGRGDIYSLACVVFEMLAGEPPYTGPTAQAVIAKRFGEPIPRLSTLRAVPPGLEAAVTRALAKAPADRFATASEFSRALQSASPAIAVEGGKRGRGAAVRLLLGAALLVVVAGSYLLWKNQFRLPGSEVARTDPSVSTLNSGPDSGPSLAVLPFTNLSPDRENEYFSDGMTEELITALGRVDGLRVAARTSAFALKGKRLDVRAIGETLHVATVLEGSVRRIGDKLRVAAQLVDARSGYHLWSDEYDRRLKDVFSVQDELARAIVSALRVRLKLRGGEDTALLVPSPRELEAHDLYLQGRYELNQRTYESLRRAVSYFDRALAQDSTYAQAYAGLADTYGRLPLFGPVRPSDAYQQSKRAAERALALDSALDGAHAALADALMLGDYDWRQSEAEYRRTFLLNPSYAIAHNSYANLLRLLGRMDEAVAERERARSLDPLSRPIGAELGRDLEMVRRFDDALRQLRTTLESDTNFARVHLYLCLAYLSKRTPRKATGECERAVTLTGGYQGMGPLAYAYAASGDRSRATALLRQLEDRARREYVPPWELAVAHLGLGDIDGTFAWLDSAYTARDPSVTLGLSEPIWDPVRGDPRFARLRARMGLGP